MPRHFAKLQAKLQTKSQKQLQIKSDKTPLWPKVIAIISPLLFVTLSSLNLKTAIWFDEAYSAYLIRGNFANIWQMTAKDVHPPFYYFCLKVWSQIFGNSDFALRFMSVFLGAIGIIILYFFLRRNFHYKIASISALLLSIAPIFIRYSQEMRMYTLVFVIVASATSVLDLALKKHSKTAWAIYAIFVSLGMWTHYFTALAWISQLAYILYYFRKHLFQKAIFWVYPLAILLFLPWLPSFFSQVVAVQSGFWIPPVSLTTPISFITESLIYRSADQVQDWLFPLAAITIIIAIILLYRSYHQGGKTFQSNFLFTAFLTFLPPIILMLLSLPPLKPTYMTRYIVYSASLLWVMFGFTFHLFQHRQNRPLLVLFVIPLLACSLIGIISVNTRNNDTSAQNIITDLQAKSSAPVLAHVDPMDYYNLFFYEQPNQSIFAYNIDFVWSSLEPIRAYRQNLLENPDTFLAEQNHFWLIITDEDHPNDYNFNHFTTDRTLKNDHFTAIEYIRQNS